MLQRLRKKLSNLSLRSTSRSEKEDKGAGDDEQDPFQGPVPTFNATTSSDEAASDAPTAPVNPHPSSSMSSDAPLLQPPTRPALWVSTPSSSVTNPSSSSSNPPPSPSLPPSSRRARSRLKPTQSPASSAPPSPSAREYSWREQRLSSRAVPASIVHSYKPGAPKPRTKTKLTSLPPELLLAAFAYLQGDPTRAANVEYRGASDERDRWYSHDWSLMQVARTCRYLRDIAGPMLYSHAALLHKEDFARLIRLPDSMRARIRHLTVSITALEQLYVHLTVLALSTPSSPSTSLSLASFPQIRVSSPHTSPFPSLSATTPMKKPYLRGTPFAPFFVPTQLISLTLFRPRGASTRSGDAVLPGFAEFFISGVLGYWRAVETLHIRDERAIWPVLGDVAAGLDVDLRYARTLEWDIALALPARLGDGLRTLALGDYLPPALPGALRVLRTKASVPAGALPPGLETLHVLPPEGLFGADLGALPLPRLAALRELRLGLASLTSLQSLALPAGLSLLQLHVPEQPAFPLLERIVSPLPCLHVLSVVLPSSIARTPTPTRAICDTDAAHATHLPLARALLETACSLREVHIGTGELEACVWGRPSWIPGPEAREGDVVWLGTGERTLL